jgi:hypothetical protein
MQANHMQCGLCVCEASGSCPKPRCEQHTRDQIQEHLATVNMCQRVEREDLSHTFRTYHVECGGLSHMPRGAWRPFTHATWSTEIFHTCHVERGDLSHMPRA